VNEPDRFIDLSVHSSTIQPTLDPTTPIEVLQLAQNLANATIPLQFRPRCTPNASTSQTITSEAEVPDLAPAIVRTSPAPAHRSVGPDESSTGPTDPDKLSTQAATLPAISNPSTPGVIAQPAVIPVSPFRFSLPVVPPSSPQLVLPELNICSSPLFSDNGLLDFSASPLLEPTLLPTLPHLPLADIDIPAINNSDDPKSRKRRREPEDPDSSNELPPGDTNTPASGSPQRRVVAKRAPASKENQRPPHSQRTLRSSVKTANPPPSHRPPVSKRRLVTDRWFYEE
jgi:hypothetical protein